MNNTTDNSIVITRSYRSLLTKKFAELLKLFTFKLLKEPRFDLKPKMKAIDFTKNTNWLYKLIQSVKAKFTFNRLRLICEKEIKSLNQVFIEKPFLLLFLLLGLIPAFTKFGSDALEQKQKIKSNQLDFALIDIPATNSLNQLNLSKTNSAQLLSKYKEALKYNPENIRINAEIAALYLIRNDKQSAYSYIKFVNESKEKGSNFYKNCLNGFVGLHQGHYLKAYKDLSKANKLFLKENPKTIFTQEWIEDSLGASLIAMQKNDEAFNLVNADIAGDCQTNPVIHEACMRRIATWHKAIANIEFAISKELLTKEEKEARLEKAFYHQKRQLIFLGESLKSSFNSINDNDGLFRQQLINQHKTLKSLLSYEYSKYNQQLHLFKENLDIYDLTKSEKKIKPL